MSVYPFSVATINGEEQSLSDYREKVLLIVNTASKCGFTPQYEGLQRLYDTYKDQGFVVLAFPSNQFMNQEPGSEEEIQTFCQKEYKVTFPMFNKINVRGKEVHPLFDYLTKQAPGLMSNQIKWNFTKFLVNREGYVIKRFAPRIKPDNIEHDIKLALGK
ncbi:glutathione peroxidase [Aquibacillus sp. 3ASR75-11]|uniref:Glutathione peroxidase n=1 Tax=Terrihalobacillus insolitus TaxID=2950438 RepID=A0A9X4AMC9_9BACI|nr:glutathione peroxidase [Terrihalobacillus insolitus]MDC3413157.1 glutathione peroxidase [Terrihalobacillus insolitus]MDC3425171.1 glutathione peroxidase [Terrihalobacillus insolitus]